ncbi:MAG: YfcC family protein [Cellulophaga sp.]|nr:YfcC family protein [Cellulophaga sp.]
MKKFPNAIVIILLVILISWLSTFIIPQGSYERAFDETTETTTVVPNSYQQKDEPHLKAFDLLLAIPKGIVGRADLVVLILLLGGCFYLIEKTGALNQGLNQLIKILAGKESLALVIITLLFITAGFTIALQEEVIAMTPILLLFGRSIGYNAKTIVAASLGGAIVGASFSPFNPFGVVIAQKEAGVELLSGYEFRLVVLLIASIAWMLYVLQYSRKNRIEKSALTVEKEHFSFRNKLILSLLALTFAGVTYGLIALDWGFNEMSACFFILGLVCGTIAGFSFNKTTEIYIDGFKEMVFAALIIGLANGVSVILKDGMVIDSIVYGLFRPLENLPPTLSAVLMMVSHSIIHFPMPSTSGHAILTMPILSPLADLIGLSRQVCVLAYQYGAIMMDLIVPTNGATMAVIALAGINYKNWIQFIIKPVLLMLGIGAIAIVIAVQIGYH